MAKLGDYAKELKLGDFPSQKPTITVGGKSLVIKETSIAKDFFFYLLTLTKLAKRNHEDRLYLGGTLSDVIQCLASRGFFFLQAQDMIRGLKITIDGDRKTYSVYRAEEPEKSKRVKLDPTKQTVIEFFPKSLEEKTMSLTLGAIIRAAREKVQMSGMATELACGIKHRGRLAQIELHGKYPSEGVFIKICAVLNMGDPKKYYHLFPKGSPSPYIRKEKKKRTSTKPTTPKPQQNQVASTPQSLQELRQFIPTYVPTIQRELSFMLESGPVLFRFPIKISDDEMKMMKNMLELYLGPF